MDVNKQLNQIDYFRAAEILQCEPAAVYAVREVESSGSGFFPDGRPVILFEAQIFSMLTGHQFDFTHPNISSPIWNRALYKGGMLEYDRLKQAKQLNEEAALKSASWGLFQIMGMNHRACGYPDVFSFVKAMFESEANHLMAFVTFIKANQLDDELRDRRWTDFAKVYNGPGYAQNQYDAKLEQAYLKYSRILTVHG